LEQYAGAVSLPLLVAISFDKNGYDDTIDLFGGGRGMLNFKKVRDKLLSCLFCLLTVLAFGITLYSLVFLPSGQKWIAIIPSLLIIVFIFFAIAYG